MLVMMFLSVPVIFGSLRTVTMGARLVIAIVIGFSFYLLQKLVGLGKDAGTIIFETTTTIFNPASSWEK